MNDIREECIILGLSLPDA